MVCTDLWNKELLLSGKVEMNVGEYEARGFSKFVFSFSCKFEKPLPHQLLLAGIVLLS